MIRFLKALFSRIDILWQKYLQLPVTARWAIQLGSVLFLMAIAPSGGRWAGPLLLLILWGCLSADVRTIRNSSLLCLFSLGFIILPPLASTCETPLMIILGGSGAGSSAAGVATESLLMLAVLAGMCLWHDARLRIGGMIMDFALAGLSLGVGLECGIASFILNAPSHQGMSLGALPQWPGLLGHPTLTHACASPAMWGLGLGLFIGWTRHFLGPDFIRQGVLGRNITLGASGGLILWLMAERMAFASPSLAPVFAWLYGFDLQGRLFAYAAALLAALSLLLEWLLLQEEARGQKTESLRQVWKRVWVKSAGTPMRIRIDNLQQAMSRRRVERELAAISADRMLLAPSDQIRSQARMVQLNALLTPKGVETNEA